MRQVFGTEQHVVIFPSSGSGAWEAALVNTLKPGDKVLMAETGHFATLWKEMATQLGLAVEFVPGDWRHGADINAIAARLEADRDGRIAALAIVHNETSTGCLSQVQAVRQTLDAAGHHALLLVDAISSLACVACRHDEWGVDVTVSCSQKGLMLPPGLGFNAISAKALGRAEEGGFQRSYWDWRPMLANNANGYFPYTPATNMLYGLREALDMLFEEGLPNVFARHSRHGEATRRAVRGWGLEVLCRNPEEYSPSLTAVLMPQGHDADALRKTILERFDMSLGTGLGRLAGKIFRIGHLGHYNDLTLAGALSGVQMGLGLQGLKPGDGLGAALDYLATANA